MKTFEERLNEAAAGWVRDGLLSPQQSEALLARHPPQPGGHRLVAILSMIGGLLLALGVVLVIASNWQEIGDWTKIGGVVALLATAYAAGWRLKVAPGKYPMIGDSLLMTGGLLFLGGIGLVSQIFHLNSRPATGLLIWFAGIAGVPWLTRAKGAQFLSVVAGLLWLGWEFGTAGGPLALGDGPGFNIGIISWGGIYALLGLALFGFGLGLRSGAWALFAGMHEKLGLTILCVSLYLLGFARHERGQFALGLVALHPAPYILVSGLAVTSAVWAWRTARRELVALGPWLGLALVPIMGALGQVNLGDDGWLLSILAWGSLFVLNIFMVRAGLATGREGWVNLGLGFIALNIITRYFDLFGTMLQGGVLFIVAGGIIVGLGIFLEKRRRALLAQIRSLPA